MHGRGEKRGGSNEREVAEGRGRPGEWWEAGWKKRNCGGMRRRRNACQGTVPTCQAAYCEAAPPLGCLPARLPRLTSSLLRGSTHCVSWELNNCRGGGEHTQ